MISSNFFKTLRPSLQMASAALLLHFGSVSAADKIDAQSQARELFTGKASNHTAVSSATRVATAASRPDVDPQEQARRIVLGIQAQGKTIAAVRFASTSQMNGHSDRRISVDAQTRAQRIILGSAP